MKKGLRGFLAFSPMAYRILAWIVFPCLILALRILIAIPLGFDDGSQVQSVMMGIYLVVLELVSDYWLFGGICSKEAGCPVYLKTSQCGPALFRDSLRWDLVRRFVWIMGYAVICFAIFRQPGELVNGLLMYVVVAAGLNLTRHQQVLQYMMLVSVVGVLAYVLLRIPGMMLEAVAGAAEAAGVAQASVGAVCIAEAIVCIVLGVIVSALTIRHMTVCMKGDRNEE